MKAVFVVLSVALVGCAATPIDTRGMSADLAGRCKLMALTAVPSADSNSGPAYYGTSGLLAMAIKQNNNALVSSPRK